MNNLDMERRTYERPGLTTRDGSGIDDVYVLWIARAAS
jgi:hypothetical protein